MKRPRLRKWAKWACTVAAGAAVALAVFSKYYKCRYAITSNSGDTWRSTGVAGGLIWATQSDGWRRTPSPPPLGWEMGPADRWYWGLAGEMNPPGAVWDWHAGVCYARVAAFRMFGVSVLYPLALTLIPAGLLWYADRRRLRPGLCGGCGYDRRGLAADAKCPECGTVPAPASK
jgi:hypothetical protein